MPASFRKQGLPGLQPHLLLDLPLMVAAPAPPAASLGAEGAARLKASEGEGPHTHPPGGPGGAHAATGAAPAGAAGRCPAPSPLPMDADDLAVGAGAPAPPHPETCSICMENLSPGELLRVLPSCGHAFHARCRDGWLQRSAACPNCRRVRALRACVRCLLLACVRAWGEWGWGYGDGQPGLRCPPACGGPHMRDPAPRCPRPPFAPFQAALPAWLARDVEWELRGQGAGPEQQGKAGGAEGPEMPGAGRN
jgi:hypothetical protein